MTDPCVGCHLELLPPEPLNEGHIAVRWSVDGGDHIKVTLDGVECTNGCREACPGDDGFVVLYEGAPRERVRCETDRRHARQVLRRGRVTVSIHPR